MAEIATSVGMMSSVCVPALANGQQFQFDISAGVASEKLIELARISNTPVVFYAGLRTQTHEVHGQYTTEAALI